MRTLFLRNCNWEKDLKELERRVARYADNDEEYGWHETNGYRWPKRALLWYAMGRSHVLRKILPEYEPFAPQGLKMGHDDQYHSDVWVGAGLDPDGAYAHAGPACDALHEAVREVEEEWRDRRHFDFTILADGRKDKDDRFLRITVYNYEGPQEEGVWTSSHIDSQEPPDSPYAERRAVSIPQANVEHQLACRNADVILTEVGGPMAHMAIVAREQGKLLLRVDNATQYTWPCRFQIDLDDLKLEAITR